MLSRIKPAKPNDSFWLVVVILFAVGVTVLSLSHIAIGPWKVLPDIGSDGAKNTFTYLYHSVYEKGYWIDGMNYPYGDHIVYTDEALQSTILSMFGNVTHAQALAFQWILISLGYAAAVVFIYLILRRFNVRPAIAMIFAGLITVFTPQILRVEGHFGLSFACFIPMLFYWTLRYHERNSIRYCVYTYLLGLTMTFVHPYYGAIVLIWTAFYALGYMIFVRGAFFRKVKYLLPMLISVVLVFVTVAIVMKATDPIKDRPITPYTTPDWNCHKKQVITSYLSPIWKHANEKGYVGTIGGKEEGYAYIGFVVMIAVGISFLVIFWRRFVSKASPRLFDESFPPIWLFIAFASLLFAMGAPFIWHMQWLYDYLSFFKQFRSLGRFAWIFYYIIAIYSTVMINGAFNWLVAQKKTLVAYGILVFAVGLWSYEASGYVKYSRNLAAQGLYNYDMMFSTNEQNWASFLKEHNHSRDDFQALLLLPYFHVGSEKLWVGDPGWIGTLGAKAGLQLHMPIVDAYLARTSWSQTQKQVKIVAGPYVEKPLLKDIKSRKPFLLLHFTEEKLDEDQKYLLEACDFIGFYSQCNVYACYPDRIATNDKRHADSIRNMLPSLPVGDTCIANKGTWYVEHFSTPIASLFDATAMPEIDHDDTLITSIPINNSVDTQRYEFSCWFLLDNNDYSSPDVRLEFFNSKNEQIGTTNAQTIKSVDSYGMWFRTSCYFTMSHECSQVKCVLVRQKKHSYKYMDELMLRPADALIISKDARGKVMVNNHLFRP